MPDIDRLTNAHHLWIVLTLAGDGRVHSASPWRHASIHVHEDGVPARCITRLVVPVSDAKFVRRYPCTTRWRVTRSGRKVLNGYLTYAGSVS